MRKYIKKTLFVISILCANNMPIFAADDYVFESNNDGTCKITDTGTFESTSELLIPTDSPNGEKIVEFEDYALYKCEADTVILSGLDAKLNDSILAYSECKNLIIEDCTLEIGSSFASNMEDLESLTITNSELTFDDYAFYKLGDDATVTLTNSTLEFGTAAFEYSNIDSLTISSCDIVADSSFVSNCEDISSFNMKDTTCELDEYAFYKFGDKATVTLQGCTGEFDNAPFEYGKITDLTINNCELEFGDSAFANNGKLQKVIIGNGNYTFGEYCFYKCGKLTEFTIGTDTPGSEYAIENAFGEYCKKLTDITINSGTYTIGTSFFSNCRSLTSVIIFNDAELTIGSYAFYNAAKDLDILYKNQTYSYESFSKQTN